MKGIGGEAKGSRGKGSKVVVGLFLGVGGGARPKLPKRA